jgi:hypothetical protein
MSTCKHCHGTGECFTPWDPYEGSSWTECAECNGYGIAIATEAKRHFAALLEESARVGWPAHYKRDLTLHDRSILDGRDPSEPFAWILRECGTYTICPGKYSRTSMWTGATLPRSEWKRGVDTGSSMIRTLAREGNHRFYWWDGRKLRAVESSELLDLYAEACESSDVEDASL